MTANETVLITGSSSGIGYELAKVFAAKNYNLVLVARSEDKLQQLKNEIEANYQVKVDLFPKDLSQITACYELFNELKANDITIDILINNAGFGEYGLFSETNWLKEEQMINLNILALTCLTKLFLHPMLQKGKGKILNVASTAAFLPGPLMSVYFASKAYVLSFSQAIANELTGSGVQVNVLCPGPTQSDFQRVASMESSKLMSGKIPSSKDVAVFAYDELMKGSVVSIHGFVNRLMTYASRLVPFNLLPQMVRSVQESH